MMRRRQQPSNAWLEGRRIALRPLTDDDFAEWQEVRLANEAWLTKWEPARPVGAPDAVRDRSAFLVRCDARRRERQAGSGYAFGVFVDGRFAGEMNLSNIIRGASQSGHVGYWIDNRRAGNGYTPEALVCMFKFGFDELRLHRLQVSIIPRNTASRRVVEKLALRSEGVAVRYLQIDGVWEDHIRFAMTSEEWHVRRDEIAAAWL